ncbi:uncharacterized protein [Argopecten irradians]|uniref:uncharacterized protein isoform X2 n=1 Tax=Argopecten irradians TaxID=31199 RepID=UPI0037141CFD
MHLRRSNLSTARMSLVRALVLLFTIVIDGSESQYVGISLVDFCNCWNAEVTRIINKLYVNISFNKTCWQSPSQTEDYSFLINYDSAMSFKIRITESRMAMSHLTQLDCKLSEGCSTTFKMVRNTTIEIAPDCSPCDSCMGRNTGDIPYINEHTTQLIEKVHVKKKAPPIRTIQPIESTHSVLVVIAAAVLTIVVILVFTIIITIACRKFRTRTDQGEKDGQIQTPSTNGRQHSHSLPTNLQAGDDLKEHIDSLWEASISPRTAAVYKTAINLFLHFVTLCGLFVPEDKLPCIDEDILIRFVSYCDKALLLKCATIKLYLAGIRFSYLRSGATNPLANCERLQYILKGVKKQQQGTATTRLPITFDILRKICDLLRNGVFSPVTDLLLQCMCQTAFFGFMRCGEFTRDSRGFCSEGLKMNDVIFFKRSIIFLYIFK